MYVCRPRLSQSKKDFKAMHLLSSVNIVVNPMLLSEAQWGLSRLCRKMPEQRNGNSLLSSFGSPVSLLVAILALCGTDDGVFDETH